MRSLKESLRRNISNIPGWRTNRKILVIESDDWGSIRMPSNKVREFLSANNVPMGDEERQRYNYFDTLENENDFQALFEILSKFKDMHGKYPIFTAVSVVANPDFDKIREANFECYFCEPFTKTLERYGNDTSLKMWQEGYKNRLFIPQFHGREHLNVAAWMRQLQSNDKLTHLAFDQKCWGYENTNKFNIDYQAAFDLEFPEDLIGQEKIIVEGLKLFETIHGYKADFFVPPNGPFNNRLEQIAAECGIKYMSASKIQSEPYGQAIHKKRFHWLGQRNRNNQIYITRNCFFEPSNKSKDWVTSCLSDIDNAFKWKKPVVISTHRVNYIGGLVENNRKDSLAQLEILLTKILEKWPNVEFMTSSELGDLVKNRHEK